MAPTSISQDFRNSLEFVPLAAILHLQRLLKDDPSRLRPRKYTTGNGVGCIYFHLLNATAAPELTRFYTGGSKSVDRGFPEVAEYQYARRSLRAFDSGSLTVETITAVLEEEITARLEREATQIERVRQKAHEDIFQRLAVSSRRPRLGSDCTSLTPVGSCEIG